MAKLHIYVTGSKSQDVVNIVKAMLLILNGTPITNNKEIRIHYNSDHSKEKLQQAVLKGTPSKGIPETPEAYPNTESKPVSDGIEMQTFSISTAKSYKMQCGNDEITVWDTSDIPQDAILANMQVFRPTLVIMVVELPKDEEMQSLVAAKHLEQARLNHLLAAPTIIFKTNLKGFLAYQETKPEIRNIVSTAFHERIYPKQITGTPTFKPDLRQLGIYITESLAESKTLKDGKKDEPAPTRYTKGGLNIELRQPPWVRHYNPRVFQSASQSIHHFETTQHQVSPVGTKS
jgi:hypothetical protein